MYGLLRWIGLAILFYYIMRTVRRIMTAAQSGSRPASGHDSSKEVKNASYRTEDVQDAKFKDVK